MREITEKIGVTQRTVARKVEGLKKKKVLEIEGGNKIQNVGGERLAKKPTASWPTGCVICQWTSSIWTYSPPRPGKVKGRLCGIRITQTSCNSQISASYNIIKICENI